MRLSVYSDYALRLLMYTALRPGELVTVQQVAEAYDISRTHLMKVAFELGRHGFLETQRKDLLDSIENTQASIKEIDEVSREKFDEAFRVINENFSVTFTKLFGGGQAHMKLTDEANSAESGIDDEDQYRHAPEQRVHHRGAGLSDGESAGRGHPQVPGPGPARGRRRGDPAARRAPKQLTWSP